jgi:hypothetical protein
MTTRENHDEIFWRHSGGNAARRDALPISA